VALSRQPGLRAEDREWLKTLRKKKVYVVFASQSLADLTQSAILETVKESCYTKIYLPNATAMASEENKRFYQSFGLNEAQIRIIAGSTPKREYYYTSPWATASSAWHWVSWGSPTARRPARMTRNSRTRGPTSPLKSLTIGISEPRARVGCRGLEVIRAASIDRLTHYELNRRQTMKSRFLSVLAGLVLVMGMTAEPARANLWCSIPPISARTS